MNNQIVEYLEKNKDEYTQESLTKQLEDAGHDPQEIQAAMALIYGTQSVPLSPEPKEEKRGWLRKIFRF